jgi:hypothetical protein
MNEPDSASRTRFPRDALGMVDTPLSEANIDNSQGPLESYLESYTPRTCTNGCEHFRKKVLVRALFGKFGEPAETCWRRWTGIEPAE